MKFNKTIFVLFLALALYFIPITNGFTGDASQIITLPETDTSISSLTQSVALFYAFDLRDRETFIQLTFPNTPIVPVAFEGATAHVQIFDVSNNCNENNFFDVYTTNDTHVYNMRDIQTNDGSPSGVTLSDGAYGIVAITLIGLVGGQPFSPTPLMGNLRIIDNNGYEYRTNAQRIQNFFTTDNFDLSPAYTFNFNTISGVTLSDIIGITVNQNQSAPVDIEWNASNPLTAFNPFEIDIVDNNETIFSCRDVTFACVNQDHPLLEELLAESETSVASFEYGINNAVPHSKGGELLCPGNTISEGFVTLNPRSQSITSVITHPYFFGFVGLNNGNGRGSMDSFWLFNFFIFPD